MAVDPGKPELACADDGLCHVNRFARKSPGPQTPCVNFQKNINPRAHMHCPALDVVKGRDGGAQAVLLQYTGHLRKAAGVKKHGELLCKGPARKRRVDVCESKPVRACLFTHLCNLLRPAAERIALEAHEKFHSGANDLLELADVALYGVQINLTPCRAQERWL